MTAAADDGLRDMLIEFTESKLPSCPMPLPAELLSWSTALPFNDTELAVLRHDPGSGFRV